MGFGIQKNKKDALNWWMTLTDEPHPAYIREVSPRVRARAFACLANHHWDIRILINTAWNIDSMYRAAANFCSAHGLVTRHCLIIGKKTQELLSIPKFQAGQDHSRFEKLDYLWDDLAHREKELEAEDDKKQKKVSKAPNMYICAAQGCAIQATKKSGLSRCAGKCSPETKPGYRSKSCQKAVRILISG